jgi:hypothetical protein
MRDVPKLEGVFTDDVDEYAAHIQLHHTPTKPLPALLDPAVLLSLSALLAVIVAVVVGLVSGF